MTHTESAPVPFHEPPQTIERPEGRPVTIGDLLEVKRITEEYGRHLGHKPFELRDVRIAITTEIGECFQEAKSSWAWWKKLGDASVVNTDDLTEELSDVMHFFMLGVYKENLIPEFRKETYVVDTVDAVGSDAYVNLQRIITLQFSKPIAFLGYIFDFAKLFGITKDELIDCYYRKAQKNIQRWKDAHNT